MVDTFAGFDFPEPGPAVQAMMFVRVGETGIRIFISEGDCLGSVR